MTEVRVVNAEARIVTIWGVSINCLVADQGIESDKPNKTSHGKLTETSKESRKRTKELENKITKTIRVNTLVLFIDGSMRIFTFVRHR